ncbi:hypothetical protein PAMP_005634 [Pampus punctatissimus]
MSHVDLHPRLPWMRSPEGFLSGEALAENILQGRNGKFILLGTCISVGCGALCTEGCSTLLLLLLLLSFTEHSRRRLPSI